MHNTGDVRVKHVNNCYANFKYKGMKAVGVSDYTNKTPP